ncbi:thioredoxin [Salinarchaeum sp. Harcht-Bsk1]|uniref:thioredoxin n=1 Tax=Salinarchaeum sp. Harcht-Bsk1 TaxID=1333523 RepID=UPI000342442A|nr:thioredoxin [Salinarchaeum sp. Harcht-Bsk1]AGN00599.1 thioredoxin [Salinarchaeum sp. Harcht-Bsk1]
MSDTEDSEVEAIREQKRQELVEAATGSDAPDEPIHVEDEAHFEELLETHDVVLVDFYADWCGPCDMLEPIVEDVAAESDAAVAKLDIDALQRVAQSYGVRSVPTLIVFADGEQAEQMVGVQQKGAIMNLLERVA